MAQLKLLIGRANTGKSQRILEEICRLGDSGKQILLVPEHVSHATEMDLLRLGGAKVSRHAEVLSPRQLAKRVLALTGGLLDGALDAGGKLLMMQLALQETVSVLRVYARPSRKAPFLSELVELCDELQACGIRPEQLGDVCESVGGMSGDKLHDLSLIYASYLRYLHREGEDRRDLMTKLVEDLERSGYADGKDIYLDGFSYFTAQEEEIISVFLRRGHSVTVSLMGEHNSELEIFRQSLRTRDRLIRLAGRSGAECEVVNIHSGEPKNSLQHLEKCFFGGGKKWEQGCDEVTLYRADTMFSEIESIAAEILRLVRTEGYRFREISVVARNLDDYSATIENVFERYGVPFYLSQRSDILEKPVLSLIAGVLDSIAGGYEYEDMFRWLKTGLAGITDEECDILENYVIQWDIHGSMWVRDDEWVANPDGWRDEFSREQTERLAYINTLRKRVSTPLRHLAEGLKAESGASGKMTALWRFLAEIGLARQLSERTTALEELGDLQQASEYSQLWDLLCEVMDQFVDTLGDMALDQEEFARLMKLVLTQYDVGTIPVSLDQVQVTQITRNDRHRIRCLFLIGCNDHVLPSVPSSTGLLSREDRSELLDRGIELAPSGLDLLDIELQNLYAVLAQPTDRLFVTWPVADLSGNPLRPSFVISRIRSLLPGVRETAETADHDYRLSAPIPALEMAGDNREGELWKFFAESGSCSEQLAAMERAAGMKRGRLSEEAVKTLYGQSYRMSASRIDKINSCHFAYFMQYGLRAKERTAAGFDAAQVGTFLHYVLEHVVRRVMEQGGFGELQETQLQELISRVIKEYIDAAIPGFDEKEARFRYLFQRLGKTVTAIVTNVAEEMKESDFIPMFFELNFGDDGDLPAVSIHVDDASLTVNGKVDRVDGWVKDGKLYLRVVDYKSGKKAFDLSDVRHGLNIQMLLYLFALEREGKALFSEEIVPAGVLYLPARDVLIHAPRGIDNTKLRAEMDKELRRSGMVLDKPEVLNAMEHGVLDGPRFLPIALDKEGSITKGVATAEELGKLGRYVDKLLERIAREMRSGNIDADPCGRGENDNVCMYCEFASACHFADLDPEEHLEVIRSVKPEDFWRYVDETIGEEADA